MDFYHVTTPKKAQRYKNTGCILSPVRGFTTQLAAMAWGMKTGRSVVYKFTSDKNYKLPDHHNKFGEAWWADENIGLDRLTCVFSADRDG